MKNSPLRVGPRGTVTLPKLLREQYALGTHDLLLAEPTPEGILLRPAVATPIEIYTDERIAEFAESEREMEELSKKNPKIQAWLERGRQKLQTVIAPARSKSTARPA